MDVPREESPYASGDRIAGRFVLERKLGQGGMGTVWAARHTMTGRRVALKFLRAQSDAAMRQRLLREARAAGTLDHPNVCQVSDVLELAEDGLALVLELLEGETLAARLERCGRLSTEETARLLGPVVSAIGTAHAHGIVHRDIKPENLFVTRGDVVKVLDFGIAKVRSTGAPAEGAALTATGSVLGTPAYMAPEQIFGEKDVDHRADIWALGLVLYECLSGRSPTRDQAANVGQVLKTILARPIPPLSEVAPEVPDDVVAITMRMIARNRRKRPETLEETFAVLRRHAEFEAPEFGRPTGASEDEGPDGATPFEDAGGVLEVTLPAGSSEPRAGATPQTIGGTSQRSSPKRRPGRSLAIAALLAVPFTLLGWQWVDGSRSATREPGAEAPPPLPSVLPSTTGEAAPSSVAPYLAPSVSATVSASPTERAAPPAGDGRARPPKATPPIPSATAKPKPDPLEDAR